MAKPAVRGRRVLGYKETTAEDAQSQADALWKLYRAEQERARRLAPGEGLDTKNGVRVAAITKRYIKPLVINGQPKLPVDEWTLSQHGTRVDQVTISVADYKADAK